jgi:hypothetical protein
MREVKKIEGKGNISKGKMTEFLLDYFTELIQLLGLL